MDIAADHGYTVDDAQRLLAESFNPDKELRRRGSVGSAHPAAVTEMLGAQAADLRQLSADWARRRSTLDQAAARLELTLTTARDAELSGR
jgi:hypothetical protein